MDTIALTDPGVVFRDGVRRSGSRSPFGAYCTPVKI